ncbi:MAG: OmpA family protein, partial [Opitutales bacterium]|nr:OmpA family protein [Opitutales bacterium]
IGGGMYNGRVMQEGILPSVYFGFDSSSISASERAKLQQAADYLMDNPAEALLIEGHCDWYGTAEYNIALGERRAISAKDYITTLGISPSRVNTLSKGSLESTSGLSKEQSSQDRRADLIILK